VGGTLRPEWGALIMSRQHRHRGRQRAAAAGGLGPVEVADPKIIQACDLMRDVLFEQLARSGQLAEIMQE